MTLSPYLTPHITPEDVNALAPGDVFVFGSNLAGRHGKGAALLAVNRFGAVRGIGEGMQGNSYAIPTKDREIRPLPIHVIHIGVHRFIMYAYLTPLRRFLVTAIGCGLAGWAPKDIAPMFFDYNPDFPTNITLPASFWPYKPVTPCSSSFQSATQTPI